MKTSTKLTSSALLVLRGARASVPPTKAGARSAFRRIFILALGAAALLLPSIGHAQDTWTFDPTFQRTPLRITSECASGVKFLSSGKVLTFSINAGLMSGANGQRIGALVRMDPNTGAIDPTWNPDPTLTGYGFLGVAEALDGKIYYSTALNGEVVFTSTDPAVNRLIRLNTDGTRDPSFNSPIFGTVARFVSVQTDGKIIVCFGGTNSNGVPPPGSITHTVRLNTDGTLDPTFQSPIFQANASDPPENEVGVFGPPVIDSATGKIYFCGNFRFVNGQPRKAIVRCNADGTLDSSFAPTELHATATLIARAMVQQAGGKVVLAGNRLQTAAGGLTRYALLRFNDDGTLDPAFTLVPTTTSSGVALVPGYFGPRFIRELPGGNILSSGEVVIRFLPDGTADSGFTPLAYSSPFITPNNGQVAGFRFDLNPTTGDAYIENPAPLYTRLGGVPVPGEITKLNINGTIDSQFHSPVVESENFDPNVQVAANGAVYVSGYHTDFGSAANATIARLLANGTRDATYSLGTLPFADKQASGFALLPDSSAYVVYSSGAFNGGYFFSNLARLLPTGAIDTSFRLSSDLQSALGINAFDGNDTNLASLPEISGAPSGKAYLFSTGNPQATVDANGDLTPIRINTDGTEDTGVPELGFPVGEVFRDASGITGGSTGYLQRLAQTADGGFIILASIAPFPSSTGGAPYNYKIIKLHADGSRDVTFNSPSLTNTASPIQDFTSLFDPVSGLVTQPPNGFYRAADLPITAASMLSDGSVLLAGFFRLTGGSTDFSLAKLTATGAFDNSFTPPVLQNLAQPSRPALPTSARVAPGDKLWVLGRFDTIGGNPAPGVARLNPDGTLDNTFLLTGVSFYDSVGFADVVFTHSSTAYLVGSFRQPGEPVPFAVTRIVGPPIIVSPTTALGTVGVPFTYQFAAQGATTLGVTNLPAGLTFNSNLAAITGTPTVAGVTQVGLSATNGAGTTTATLTLNVQPPPSSGPTIISSTAATGRAGQPFSFQVFTTGGTPAARVSATGLPPGLSIDAVTGRISGTPAAEGSLAVALTVTDGLFTANSVLQLTITADATVPVITSSSSASLTPGEFFSYTITAPSSGGPTTFTLIGTLPTGLSFNGIDTIFGTYTPPLLRGDDKGGAGRPEIAGGTIGSIQLFGTNSHGTSTLPLLFGQASLGVVNISARLLVETGENVLIGGFIITGDSPKVVIIRAIGPSTGVPGALQDPTLELHSVGHPTVFNDNWKDTQEQIIRTAGIPPTDDRESAIVAALDPGAYTAIVAGKNGTTGIGVVEVYDLGTASIDPTGAARLANISTRAFVGTGNDVMIGGFIIHGPATSVIVRAIGPSLSAQGVEGALQDTVLELRDGSGSLIASNDDWRSTQEQQIIDTGVPPPDDRESAIVATLNPGPYTGLVKGKDDTTGVGLVDVYALGENLRLLPQERPVVRPVKPSLGVSSKIAHPRPAVRVHRHSSTQEQRNRRSPRLGLSTQ